jgi:uncharacterized protein (DUF1800 family)
VDHQAGDEATSIHPGDDPARDAMARTSRASRRAMLAGMLSTIAVAARADTVAGPVSAMGDVDPSALLVRLVKRLTFGISAPELASAVSLGYAGYLEQQLNPESVDDASCLARIAPLTSLTKNFWEIYRQPSAQVVNELIEAAILRAVYSRRQLFERMVDFWTDHFNIDVNKDACAWLKIVDDREVVRSNALGKFGDLLAASAMSPAMLYFLDNHLSIAGNPTLNYSRELMELHTIGVDGGYTEADVGEVARCFTGWQFTPDTAGSLAGIFRFNASQHDNSAKRVLGHDIPAGGGVNDGLTVLRILADHPSTARFVSRKLCRRFLGEGVPESVTRAAAARFTATDGDIREVMRCILAPQHMAVATPRFKRPFHLYASAIRATGSQIVSTGGMRAQLRIAGHLNFNWPNPDGYPDRVDFWSGLALPRWNFAAQMMNNAISGITPDPAAFFAGLSTAEQMASRIDAAMFGHEMPPFERSRVRDYLAIDPSSASVRAEALGLAAASPAFQWY